VTPLQVALQRFAQALAVARDELVPDEYEALLSILTVWVAHQNARLLDVDERAA
jgi:hypothetical protein